MMTLIGLARRFSNDKSGATLIEYTILAGIVAVVTVALIASVGNWVEGQWSGIGLGGGGG